MVVNMINILNIFIYILFKLIEWYFVMDQDKIIHIFAKKIVLRL